MTDETNDIQAADAAPEAVEAEEPAPEPKIMCYVSKEMVPLSETVEVEYSHGKKFRVLPKYVKFGDEPAAS